ncbi:polysaccharide deacetylase family protein [Anthocerotibacter panamensis]|uniref:polysaccharide deacetylase family protein n=1 Tax=Anthocerotibacter panamensis TaxID=2857077 RepID=UPI001C4022C8|nr:polysaccharide deacetylase family protein [Anthocerotibacter panamensis]
MAKPKRNRLRPGGFLLLSAAAFGAGFALCYAYLTFNQPRLRAETPVAQPITNEVSTPAEPSTEPEPALVLRPEARTSRIPAIMYHDIRADKKVIFDVTPKKFRTQLEMIREHGSTPISLDQLEAYLTKGEPLPPKPILLTFDDGYLGQLTEAYPLLKEFNYPAVFYVHTAFVGSTAGRPHMSWEQLQHIEKEGLVTIASHTVTHPADLTQLTDEQIRRELFESKRILEEKLGKPVLHLAYPVGKRDERVLALAREAGYHTATTMDEGYVGTSPDLLEINRFGQSHLAQALENSSGEEDPDLAISTLNVNFDRPLSYVQVTVDGVQLSMAVGGRPYTVHGDRRYNLKDYMAEVPEGAAAVTGTFFPLRGRDPSKLIGPVLSQNEEQYHTPPLEETGGLDGRPLVLIGQNQMVIAPFNRGYLLQDSGVRALLPDVRDAFLAGTWLVRAGVAQGATQMKKVNLGSYLEVRHRSFIGVYGDGRFVAGITHNRNNAPDLSKALAQAGIQEAVLMDSGASTDLVYRGQSLVQYEPRPVPHAIVVQAAVNPDAPPPKLPLATGKP